MAIEPRAIAQRFQGLVRDVGLRTANALYPKDINFYYIAFELVNSKEESVEFFAFPVMPSQISENKAEISNIRKTAGGITVMNTSNFVPRDIILSGNFGRQFKILLRGEALNFNAISFSTQTGNFTKNVVGAVKQTYQQLDPAIKNGYGCVKILESIIEKSNSLDENGESYRLYFYNPSLGNNYLVKPVNFTQSLNESESNMIVGYSLNLKAIAPLDQVSDILKTSVIRNLTFDALEKNINGVANDIKAILRL